MPQKHSAARHTQHKAEGARGGSLVAHDFLLLEKSQSRGHSSAHSEAMKIYLASAARLQTSEQRPEYSQDAFRSSKTVGE